MKKLFLLLLLVSTLGFGLDKQVTAPTGGIVVKGKTTAKVQTYATGAWQDRISVLNDGKVGIGVNPPTVALDVNGTIKAGVGIMIAGTPTAGMVGEVINDRSKVIDILMRDMSHEDAEEFFEFNIQCAYVGDRTPVFATILIDDLEHN